DTDDDALTFKSTSGSINENITVTNCVLSSHCNAIKFGTETIGGFKNVSISNVVVKPSASKNKIYGLSDGIGGIVLSIVDGGIMDGITISNVRIDGVQTPIFLRLGNRGRTIRKGMPKPPVGIMRNINISNIIATNVSNIGSSINGIPGHNIENVSLNNITIRYSGGEGIEDTNQIVPEKEDQYPESNMFGKLPAYGFFIRHVKGLTLNNFNLNIINDEKRPALIINDADNINVYGFKAYIDKEAESFIELINTRNMFIYNSRPYGSAKCFLYAEGKGTKNINLSGNDYSKSEKIIETSDGVRKEDIILNYH
ncbi:MAG: hypothetical protein P8Z35_21920, partial [Ignavibacteriaceae bacterium]